jgi:hypothetical protein
VPSYIHGRRTPVSLSTVSERAGEAEGSVRKRRMQQWEERNERDDDLRDDE